MKLHQQKSDPLKKGSLYLSVYQELKEGNTQQRHHSSQRSKLLFHHQSRQYSKDPLFPAVYGRRRYNRSRLTPSLNPPILANY
jgi:hypothetical protein